MPDIFGKEPRDYEWVRYLQAENLWEEHQRALIEQARFEVNKMVAPHDFNAIGTRAQIQQRAIEDQSAIGFLTNNLLTCPSRRRLTKSCIPPTGCLNSSR